MAGTSNWGTLAIRGREPRGKAYDSITTPIVSSATYVFESSADPRAERISTVGMGQKGHRSLDVMVEVRMVQARISDHHVPFEPTHLLLSGLDTCS